MLLRVVLLAALLAPWEAGAVNVYLPRPALCARADLVVIGEVTGAAGRWGADGEVAIVTEVDVAVTRTVRGAAPEPLVVTVPGGRVAGTNLHVSEAPTLRTDARYLLFLRAGPGGYTVLGGPDGAVPVPWGPEGEAAAIASLGSCRAE